MNINSYYFNKSLLLVLLTSIINPSFASYIRRGLLEINKAAIFQLQVRQGDILPQGMIDEVYTRRGIRFLIIGGSVAAADIVGENQTYTYLICNSDRIAGKT